MTARCNVLDPWTGNDLVPCFREVVINGAVPLFVLAMSLIAISIASWRSRASANGYQRLKDSMPIGGYGTISVAGSGEALDNDSRRLMYDRRPSRWLVTSWVRLLSFVLLAVYVWGFVQLGNGTFRLDDKVEGSASSYLTVAYSTHIILWAIASVLSIANIYLSSEPSVLADQICYQLNLLYFIDFMVGLVNLRSYYLVYDVSISIPGYKISIVTTAVILVLLCAVALEERDAPREPVLCETGRIMSGEVWASIYSQLMFSWVNDMMCVGYAQTLNDNDLIEMPADNRANNALHDYQKHKRGKIARNLLLTFKKPLIIQLIYSLIWTAAMFGPPYFLNKTIKFIEQTGEPSSPPVFTAFLYVFGLFFASVVQSLSLQQSLYIGRTLGIRLQAIVVGEVFSKSLRRRDTTNDSQDTDGKSKQSNVNNLLSVDARKVGEITAYIFYLYSYPLQISICTWGLYALLGNAALWGVLVMVLSQPLTYFISRRFEKLHERAMSATDGRLKIMNELLSAIRIVKFFAWEKEFRQRVLNAREKELKMIRERLMMYLWMASIWVLISVTIMVVVFYRYTLDAVLTASIAFTAISLFHTLRGALDELPMILSFLLQANVSLSRVESYLQEDEVESFTDRRDSDVHVGFVDNATFSWEKPSESLGTFQPHLKNLNLSFPRGKLSIVCGPTGSGKTTLVASLLGETYCLGGAAILPRRVPYMSVSFGGAMSGVAYVAQSAWLQNCSIRDNILFGLDYDQTRYERVLYMTALTKDLDILEYGDSTEIGEKGITLSGGQKQRVAIARALYSKAETIILDDCLSAVDAHTAKHIYEHCLLGDLMRGRTVILVTHYVGLCMNGAAYMVALKDGQVACAGHPVKVVQSGVLGEELMHVKKDEADAKEERAQDGPIPTVPKQTKTPQKDGTGQLVKEEIRAQGSVSWSVYATYFTASGGYPFWISVLILFCLTQATILGQDYWIKVWASAYRQSPIAQVLGASTLGFSVDALIGWNSLLIRAPPTSLDTAYYLGVYMLIGVISLIVAFIRGYTLYYGTIKASRSIHTKLLDSILRAKVRFFDVTPLGRIVNRFSSDLETVDQSVGPQLSDFLVSLVATLCVVLLVTTITPLFLIPGSVIAVLYWKIAIYYLKTSRDLKRMNSVTRSPIYVHFSESVNGVATIRAFGSQRRFMQDSFRRVDDNNRPFIWMWATNRWLHCRVDILSGFVGFCTGFVLVLCRSWIDPGLAGLSLSYALMFTQSVLWVVRSYAMNEMNGNAIERVDEYLDVEPEPPAVIPEHTPRPTWPETGTIEVKDLVMRYTPENPPVLRQVSFSVKPYEKIGIVGRTGSGKSTLAMSLFRFMEPTSGQIFIDGVDISQLGLEDLRSRLTIIPQDPVLFSGTLRSNLDPFHQHDDAELWEALQRSHLVPAHGSLYQAGPDEPTAMVHLDSPVAENGSNWSQGQRQLIALARALVKKSSLIILDEATSSVDFDTDHKIQQTIRSAFMNSALLCIAHRIRTVADYDRILVLDQGQVVEYDTPFALMSRPDSLFRHMCERSGEYDELFSIAKAKAAAL